MDFLLPGWLANQSPLKLLGNFISPTTVAKNQGVTFDSGDCSPAYKLNDKQYT